MPARAHALRQGQGHQAHANRTQDTRVAEPRIPAPAHGRPGERHQTPLTTMAGHPPGDGHPPPPRHAAPTGHASQGGSAGPPHTHTRAHITWIVDPDSPAGGRAVGGGGAPDPRRPSQRRKAPPRGRPSATPTARNAAPTPAPTAPGTHGSRNPGCAPQRTGGRGRDSA